MTSVEVQQPLGEGVVAAADPDAPPGERRRGARGGTPLASAARPTPGSEAVQPVAAGGRQASLPPELAPKPDARAMPLGATASPERYDAPGGGASLTQPRTSSEAERESRDDRPDPPTDPAALMQGILPALMTMPMMLSALLPTLLAPLTQSPGGAAKPGASPVAGSGDQYPNTGNFQPSSLGPAGTRSAGGDLLNLLQTMRDLVFGRGDDDELPAERGAPVPMGSINGSGHTLDGARASRQRLEGRNTTIENSTKALRAIVDRYRGTHTINTEKFDALIREVESRLRQIYTITDRNERQRLVGEVYTYALQQAERIIGDEQANGERVAIDVRQEAAKLASAFLSESGLDASDLDRLMSAIRAQESEGSGGYAARNPDSGALGAYQIMPQNLDGRWGNWDREALGRDVSLAEFHSSPAIQDAIARHKLGQYLERYGPAGAAAAWYGGEKNVPLASTTHAQRGGYPSFRNYTQSVLGRM